MKVVFEHLPIVFAGVRLRRQKGASPFNTIYINTILSSVQKVRTIVHELLHTTVDVFDWICERTTRKLPPVYELNGLIDGKGWEHELHPMMCYSAEDMYLKVMRMQAMRLMATSQW